MLMGNYKRGIKRSIKRIKEELKATKEIAHVLTYSKHL